MQRHGTAERLRYWPKLVDPVTVIAVRVSHDQPIQAGDAGGEQLLAKVGATVDEQLRAGALDQDRGSQAIVARLIRVTLSPLVPDFRYARRRPAAENSDSHAAFGNSLKKFAVVA